jgi:RNA polymerase sigma-70 factor, ECF subfamily
MSAVRLSASLVERLHRQSQADRWGLPAERFEAALRRSVEHAFGDRPASSADAERHVQSLHLDDLALAAACAEGIDTAWQHFILQHRPSLYRAADAIDPSGGARELADSLYADLFGLTEREGTRQSLLRHFHGRSKLATWLRAVLSQRYVDRIRAGRRLSPLPSDEDAHVVAAPQTSADPDRARFVTITRQALARAIAALDARDRLRLSLYYAQDLTLGAIGRTLNEHESTVSRNLSRTRRDIRAAVERSLRDEHGLDAGAIAECFRSVIDDAGSIDMAELVGAAPERKKTASDRSS